MNRNLQRLIEIGALAFCIALSAAAAVRAFTCRALSSTVVEQLAARVVRGRHLPRGAKLTLLSSGLLPGSCMREVTLVDEKGVRYSLALSPDQRYAFPGLRPGGPPNALRFDQPARQPSPASPDPAPADDLTPSQFHSLLEGSPPVLGPVAAPVTIVEFADFQCPFCSRLASTLKSQVLPDEQGQVRPVYRQFPLPMHPWAEAAAELSECVSEQSAPAFWRLYDYFFSHQEALDPGNVKALADRFLQSDPAVNQSRLRDCLASSSSRAHVQADIEMGHQLGVHGTPTLFINGARLTGARAAAEIEAAIAAGRPN